MRRQTTNFSFIGMMFQHQLSVSSFYFTLSGFHSLRLETENFVMVKIFPCSRVQSLHILLIFLQNWNTIALFTAAHLMFAIEQTQIGTILIISFFGRTRTLRNVIFLLLIGAFDFVNSGITESELKPEDQIQIGSTVLRFVRED